MFEQKEEEMKKTPKKQGKLHGKLHQIVTAAGEQSNYEAQT